MNGTGEMIILLRALAKLRLQIAAADTPTSDQVNRYHTLVDCLLNEMFKIYGEREVGLPTYINEK